ncbi:MAG: hypothetical protein HYT16_01810 [DPANN group archaeon]|nr:hypothetical protein [DPANN group archaeon]
MKEIEIDKILFWVIIGLLIVILTWRTFGSSPPLEAVAFALTTFGAWLSWKSYKSSVRADSHLGSMDASHAEQVLLLRDIKEILERK